MPITNSGVRAQRGFGRWRSTKSTTPRRRRAGRFRDGTAPGGSRAARQPRSYRYRWSSRPHGVPGEPENAMQQAASRTLAGFGSPYGPRVRNERILHRFRTKCKVLAALAAKMRGSPFVTNGGRGSARIHMQLNIASDRGARCECVFPFAVRLLICNRNYISGRLLGDGMSTA